MPHASNLPTWQGVVDWSKNGDFTGTAEDISAYMAASPGLVIELGLDSARSFSPPRIGRARLELLNADQRFSAEFPGSPIYQLMKPARDVEYRVTVGSEIDYDSEDYYDDASLYNGEAQLTVFTGQTDELPQDPELARRRVGLTSIGTLTRLRGRRRQGRKVSTQLYESISTGTAVGYVLDAAGWPAGERSIDAGSTTLTYWWLDEEEPYQAILDLLAVEGPQAAFYEDGDGVLHFEGRNYRGVTSRCLTSQATFLDNETAGAEATYDSSEVEYDSDELYEGSGAVYHVRPFGYDQGFKNVINQCLFEIVQRTLQSLGVVWTYGGGNLTLSANEVLAITARTDDPFKAAVCTNGVDVTVSAGSIASVTLSRTSGGSTTITLTAGAGGATVNLLQLRAQSLPISSTLTVTNAVDASASIDEFELQDQKITALRDVSVADAVSVCDAIVTRYMDPLPTVSFTVSNHNFRHVYEQFFRRVSDRCTIYESHTGVSWDAHINQIVHRALEGGLIHYTTFVCEKAPVSGTAYVWDDAAAVWGTATWGA